MSEPDPNANLGQAVEATVDFRFDEATPEASRDVGLAGAHCPVALVTGSGPQLIGETSCLLRRRLRLASGLMAVGLALFLVRHLFYADAGYWGLVFFWFHLLVTVVLAAITFGLWRRCEISLAALRRLELVTFLLPAAFFLLMQYELALLFAARNDFELELSPWMVLIFTYALFIPNTRLRAATVIASLALPPVLLLVTLWLTSPAFAELANFWRMTGIPLMLALTALAAVLGVDTIGSLRREAFEARQLGQYRLKRRIGAGGMGEVYLAEHQLLKRPCVIKLIQPQKAGDPTVIARFQREVHATARLSHWNTVAIFDYGITADGTFYYVMEYLRGMSLGELVDRFGPMPPERVIYLLRQTCEALSEAHAVGLIHRDIKPGNIFAARIGGVADVAKLLDFGLVKPLLEDNPLHLTGEGTITGSPLFMAPEQAMGESHPDARSDIYSLGAVAYFLLTGRPPFQADRAIQVLLAHVREEVTPPSQLRSDVPTDLEQVVLRCLAKLPAERYADVPSLAAALDECEAAGAWSRARAAQWWQDIHCPLPGSVAVSG